jgi:pathogenesis-related protein 1
MLSRPQHCTAALFLLAAAITISTTTDRDAASAAKEKTTGSALTVKEADALVAYHNKVRKEVGVEPVKWSNDLAKFAQEWADRLAEKGEMVHRDPNKYGENLYSGSRDSVLLAGETWYSEKKDYKAGTPFPKGEDAANFKAGHYTQMVWKDTTEIGAGKAIFKSGRRKGGAIIVCNYDPAGNFEGEKPY